MMRRTSKSSGDHHIPGPCMNSTTPNCIVVLMFLLAFRRNFAFTHSSSHQCISPDAFIWQMVSFDLYCRASGRLYIVDSSLASNLSYACKAIILSAVMNQSTATSLHLRYLCPYAAIAGDKTHLCFAMPSFCQPFGFML